MKLTTQSTLPSCQAHSTQMYSSIGDTLSRSAARFKTTDFARWFVRLSAIAILVFAFLPPKAKAGSVSTDFDPSQTLPGTLYGTAATSSTGGDPNGTGTCLQFDTGNGQSGLLVLNELDPGLEVQSFVANFSLMMGNNSGALRGDGFSFSFVPGPQVPQATFSRTYLEPVPKERFSAG